MDPIDRQDAIDALTEGFKRLPTIAIRAKDMIKHLSSAQPEIIHCRDCKHYYYADNRIPQEQRYVCDLDSDRWKPDDYCSYAERRSDETD